MTQFSEWQDPYLEASTETDPDELSLKISRALRAIASRLVTVELDSISPEESEALEDALATLRTLQGRQQAKTGAA
jgi:hypothetical protein